MKRLALCSAALTLAFTLAGPHAAAAQTPAAAAAIPAPVLPLLTSYRYWPTQFVQFVGTEVPYAMIELYVDPADSKHPLYEVVLTSRATGKRIHYTDSPVLFGASKAQGDEAYKTAIAFDAADTENTGSISTLRFTMADGKPLQWRFVQGSDISEQGSGMNPFPDSKIPIFAYREQGAIAGEGTALQIGDVVSAAAVWTEISHPPYFIGYRGAQTQGSHTLVLLPGHESWKVESSPAALTVGAGWEMDEEHGNHRSIKIQKVDGAQVTVVATDSFQPAVRCTLDATRTPDGWTFKRARFSPLRDGDKHGLTLEFATPLSLAAGHTDVALLAGKKKTLAAGSLVTTDAAETLTFSTPAWLAGKSMIESITTTSASVTLTAHP